MAVDFSTLRKNSKKNFERQVAEIEKLKKGSSFQKDEREWTLKTDSAGNGFAIIRFLPPHKDEEVAFQMFYRYAVEGPNGWYIENSPTTFNQPDPMAEENTRLWKSGIDSNKDIAKKRSRKKTYVANIFVVKDAAQPECEGKNFIYKYGKRIFEKQEAIMFPPDESIDAIDPFDLFNGANFNLTACIVDGNRSYNKSTFGKQGPLFKDDGKMKVVYEAEYPLLPYLAPDQFKSYDKLKERFNKVFGIENSVIGTASPSKEPASGNTETPAGLSETVDPENEKFFANLAED